MASTNATIEHEVTLSQVQTSSARAVAWATRRGYDGRTTTDLQKIAKIATQIAIDPTEFESMEHLDRGAFGAIMKATYKGYPVAVKSIIQNDQDGKNGYSQDVRNVLLELAIVCRLSHPHIVGFWGMSTYFPESEAEDNQFHLGFVFELCSGGSLFSTLHEQGTQFSFASKLRVLREVATGMSYLHNENIVHRDLSSRNILLTDNFTVKIADFGCARKLTGESYDSSTISGSPPYMPPEQLCGEVLTLKVDVWALGTMIWEVVTEKVPWRGSMCNNVKGLRDQIVKKGERLPNPGEDSVPPGTHQPLVKLLKSTFERKPAQRPKMSQVHEQLVAIEDIICPEDWAPKRDSAVSGNVAQRPTSLMSVNPDTVQGPMGPAQLENRLRAYYKIFNPAKLRDVRLMASNFRNNQMKLNEQLRSRYNCDLWDMDDFPRIATPTPLRRKPHVHLPRNGSDTSLDERAKEAEMLGSADTAAKEASSSKQVASSAKPARHKMSAEELAARLEAYYEVYNPIKALNAKTIAAKYLDKQDALNSELKQRYHCDLFDLLQVATKPKSADAVATGPAGVDTPSSCQTPQSCQSEVSSTREESEASPTSTADDEVADVAVSRETEAAAESEAQPAAQHSAEEAQQQEQQKQEVQASTLEPQATARLAEAEAAPTVAASEKNAEHSNSNSNSNNSSNKAPNAPAAGPSNKTTPAKPLKLSEVVAQLRKVYAIVNPTKQNQAEQVVRKFKTVAALNRELQSKYGIELSSSLADIRQAAAKAKTQAEAKAKAQAAAAAAVAEVETPAVPHAEAEAAAPAAEAVTPAAEAVAPQQEQEEQGPEPMACPEEVAAPDGVEEPAVEAAGEAKPAEEAVVAEAQVQPEAAEHKVEQKVEQELKQEAAVEVEDVGASGEGEAESEVQAAVQVAEETAMAEEAKLTPSVPPAAAAETGAESAASSQAKLSLAIPAAEEGGGASTPGASSNGASQLGTQRGGAGQADTGKFAQGAESEGERRDMDMDQLLSRLRVYYQLYNAEKLPLVKEIASKFFAKQEELNATLRSRYCCDLWEVDETAVCDSVLSGRSARSRQSSVSSNPEDGEPDKEGGKAPGKSASPSKTCSEADTEKYKEEMTSDEDPHPSRGSSSSPLLEPVSEVHVSSGTTTARPKFQQPVTHKLTVAQQLHFLYARANPTKLNLVESVLAKYKGNVAALNEVLRSKYGVDLNSPREEVVKKYPLKKPPAAPVAVKAVAVKAK